MNENTVWQTDFTGTKPINVIHLREKLASPQDKAGNIRAFHIDVRTAAGWHTVYRSDIIGAYKLCVIDRAEAAGVRLIADEWEGGAPALESMEAVYREAVALGRPFRKIGYIHPCVFTGGGAPAPEQMDAVTHVIFIGFAVWNQTETGELELRLDPQADAYIERLKAVIAGRPVKILLALTNGCTLDAYDTEDKRRGLVDAAMEFVEKHRLDGIDIDNEYPYTEAGWARYGDLIRDFRKRLTNGRTLSMAVGFWNHHLPEDAAELLDFFNIMSYDDGGDFRFWHSTFGFMSREIEALDAHHIPREKANCGLPFYGLYFDAEGRYCEKAKNYSTLCESEPVFDPGCNVVDSYYFNGPAMIRDKTAMAVLSGCGGIMIWQIAGDTAYHSEKSLLREVNDTVALFTKA